ncbi:tetratricopeptide repeat protein [Streptomyces sp. NPDC051207]|uniref:tetratricopeptide repeat protein n=1 Tax=Streptomyces sp. NPDC051207 TaxID=3154641 RepID=UPI00341E4BB6
MSRLSRENTREQKGDAGSAAHRPPIEVRVSVPAPTRGADGGEDAGQARAGASVGGVPVAAADGEEIQRTVLDRLHRMALASGQPVLATVHDERMGYVIPLRIDLDGSSHLTADPVPMASPPHGPAPTPAPAGSAVPVVSGAEPPEPPPAQASVTDDRHTHVFRPVAEPVGESAPTFRMRAIPEPSPESRGAGAGAATFRLRAVPSWAAEREARAGQEPPSDAAPPGTVTAPTGAFGPPPRMDAGTHTAAAPDATRPPDHGHIPEPPRPAAQGHVPEPPRPAERGHAPEPPHPAAHGPAPESTRPAERVPAPDLIRPAGHHRVPAPIPPSPAVRRPAPGVTLPPRPGPDPKPTPARGFDAVAEAVLGVEPVTAPGNGTAPALLAEPVGRINEAVRSGRTEEAARLAEQTVADASGTLGAEHPEVLRLRELTAYIAYLAGEPVRALRLSLELAGVHRRLGDAEAAYGNVQSAATAWRAVRDPARGLQLGRELIGVWTGLAAEGGPAADEIEQLDSVRTRMERLARRARASEGRNQDRA